MGLIPMVVEPLSLTHIGVLRSIASLTPFSTHTVKQRCSPQGRNRAAPKVRTENEAISSCPSTASRILRLGVHKLSCFGRQLLDSTSILRQFQWYELLLA